MNVCTPLSTTLPGGRMCSKNKLEKMDQCALKGHKGTGREKEREGERERELEREREREREER